MTILDELDSAAQRIETPCGDGSMVWRVWNPSGGGPLVLFHGGNGSWRHWVRQIPRYAAQRCVIAPDLPGLGDSAMPPEPHDPPHSGLVAAAGLRQVLGGRRADLVGFSFGAIVGGHVAAEMNDALRSLTLLGAGSLGVPRNPVPLQKLRDKIGKERVAAHRFNLHSLMIADPALIDALAVEIQDIHTLRARFRSRGFASTASLKDALARTTMPLCVMWGERDQVAVGNIADRVAAVREVRPDAAAMVLPGTGHWAMYETPAVFEAALDGYLASLPVAA